MRLQENKGPGCQSMGVEMHCSHCKEAGHNTAGCSLKKLGLKRKAAAPQADDAEEKVLIQVLSTKYLWSTLISVTLTTTLVYDAENIQINWQ